MEVIWLAIVVVVHHIIMMMIYSAHKTRLSLVITGHFDSPKSTTRGRLLYELGWLSNDKLNKLRREVHELAKESFLFVLCMDVCKDEH